MIKASSSRIRKLHFKLQVRRESRATQVYVLFSQGYRKFYRGLIRKRAHNDLLRHSWRLRERLRLGRLTQSDGWGAST